MEIGTENSILSEYLTKAELAAQLRRSVRSVDRWTLTVLNERNCLSNVQQGPAHALGEAAETSERLTIR